MNHKSYLNGADVSFAKLAGKATTFYFVAIGQVLYLLENKLLSKNKLPWKTPMGLTITLTWKISAYTNPLQNAVNFDG